MIKRYNEFVNEGKISQFFIKKAIETINGIDRILSTKSSPSKVIKFVDSSIKKKYFDSISRVLDHFIFDAIKMYLSKKVRGEILDSNFSDYIESRSGYNIYDDIDTVIDCLDVKNIDLPEDTKHRDLVKSESDRLIQSMFRIKSIVKKIEDEVLEEKKFLEDLEELNHIISGKLSKSKLDKAINHVDNMKKLEIDDDEMNDLLDKVNEFGIESLTEDEKVKLRNWSSKNWDDFNSRNQS